MENCRHEYGGSVCGQRKRAAAAAGTPAELSAGACCPFLNPNSWSVQGAAARWLEGRQRRAGSSKYILVLLKLADKGKDLERIMHRALRDDWAWPWGCWTLPPGGMQLQGRHGLRSWAPTGC